MFTQTADQDLFEATTAQFLTENYPPAQIRALAAQGAASDDSWYDDPRWKQGAEFGWTSLLVPESLGGGSISGNGLVDLLSVAFQFGRHAAPGPLLGTNVVAAALGRWGSPDQHGGPLAELLDGSATAAWACSPATDGSTGPGVTAVSSGDGVVLTGSVPCVELGASTGYLLVSAVQTGEQTGERTHYLVPLTTPGVETEELVSLDLARRYGHVTLGDVFVPAAAQVGEAGAADAQDAGLLDVAAVIQAGEIVGATQRSFETTLQWTADRYSFGRPLGSYQEIKHRMADLRTQLEASAAVTAKAAAAVGAGALSAGLVSAGAVSAAAADARSWASAAMGYVGAVGPELIQDCIQLHGGIGVTYEHDLHLYLRRAVTDAQLYGAPTHFRQRLVGLVEAGTGARNEPTRD